MDLIVYTILNVLFKIHIFQCTLVVFKETEFFSYLLILHLSLTLLFTCEKITGLILAPYCHL